MPHRVSDMGLVVGPTLIARSIVWSQARGDAKVNHEAALPRPSSDGDTLVIAREGITINEG